MREPRLHLQADHHGLHGRVTPTMQLTLWQEQDRTETVIARVTSEVRAALAALTGNDCARLAVLLRTLAVEAERKADRDE